MSDFYKRVALRTAYNLTMIVGLFALLFGSHYVVTVSLESVGFSFFTSQIIWLFAGLFGFTLAQSFKEIKKLEDGSES
tara:strand:- start:3790 stop:4023 length:234 start_codon:yes stop_codon:yes gene_type:complete